MGAVVALLLVVAGVAAGALKRHRLNTDLAKALDRETGYPSRPDLTEVRELLAKGADVNTRGPVTGRTPLIAVLSYGATADAKQLVARGADVNASDKEGHTPLLAAVIHLDVDLVRLLLHRGADATAKVRGCGPLYFANAGVWLNGDGDLPGSAPPERMRDVMRRYRAIVPLLKRAGATDKGRLMEID